MTVCQFIKIKSTYWSGLSAVGPTPLSQQMNPPTTKRAARNLARHERRNEERKELARKRASDIAKKREEKCISRRQLQSRKKEEKERYKRECIQRIFEMPYGKDRRNEEMQEAARRLSPHNHEWKGSVVPTREEWVKSLNTRKPLMMFSSWEEAREAWKEKSSRSSVRNRKPDEKLREVFEMYGQDYPFDGFRSVIRRKFLKYEEDYQHVIRVQPGVYLVWIGEFTRRKNPPCAVSDYESIWSALCSVASSCKMIPSVRMRNHYYQRPSISVRIKNKNDIATLSETQASLLAKLNPQTTWRYSQMSKDELWRTCSNKSCSAHNIRLLDFGTVCQVQEWIETQYWGSIHNYRLEDLHPPVRMCTVCYKYSAHTTAIDTGLADEIATSVVKNLDKEIEELEAKEQTEEVAEKIRDARERRAKFLICPCDNGRGGKCGVPMEWNNGCAKMTCPQCGGSFCSRCMTETPRHDPYRHRCSNHHEGDPFHAEEGLDIGAEFLEEGVANERRNA